MLWIIVAVLLIAWLLGLLGSVGGSFVHVLLAIVLVIVLIQLLSGRRVGD